MDTHSVTEAAKALAEKAGELATNAQILAAQASSMAAEAIPAAAAGGNEFWYLLTVFVLAVFLGFYVVWSVTPALHSPLMGVTNAISSVIIVGALIAAGPEGFSGSKVLGFFA
ncbi:MAG: NAD(P) transhydrogenase subunit alpha, partial [Rhodospirillaceae bacterium]